MGRGPSRLPRHLAAGLEFSEQYMVRSSIAQIRDAVGSGDKLEPPFSLPWYRTQLPLPAGDKAPLCRPPSEGKHGQKRKRKRSCTTLFPHPCRRPTRPASSSTALKLSTSG